MLIFRRIFNFEKAGVEQLEQRLNQRYTPGASFPLQAMLSLAPYHWKPAKVLNLSGDGLGLLLSQEAPTLTSQSPRVQLLLPGHKLEFDATLSHVRPEATGTYYGLGLKFPAFDGRKAYLQLLQPIAIGQSLQPLPADRVIQNEPQFIKQVYVGESDSVLTVWLVMAVGTPLHSFEFRMKDYFCRAIMATGVLEAYALESTDSHVAKLSTPVFDTSGGLHDEIRQLFKWIVPNLSAAVPDDVRASLQRFAL